MTINDMGFIPRKKPDPAPEPAPAPASPTIWTPAPVIKPAISGFGEVSYGAKCEILGGSKYEMMAGNKSSTLLGMDNKFTFGAKTDMSIGSDLKISLGPQWTSPKNKWWPAKGFLAKYDFSDIKEHKLIINKDGSTDILVKKLTMAKNHFQASAGYGLMGNIAYTAYTNIVSNMIKVIATINILLPALNLTNGLTTNPLANKQTGFDLTSQLRTTWVPFVIQLFATYSQLVAATTVVLSRDNLKKAVLPNSVLQLREGNGVFLGSRNRKDAVLTGVELGSTVKIGARRPSIGERLTIALGANFYKKDKDEFLGFKEAPESYFETSENKAIVFSKALEFHANKNQKTEVKSKAGLLEPPNVLVKATGDSKANVVVESRTVELKSDKNPEMGFKLDGNTKNITIGMDKKTNKGFIVNTQKNQMSFGKNKKILMTNSAVVLQNSKNTLLSIDGNEILLKMGGNCLRISKGLIMHGKNLKVLS